MVPIFTASGKNVGGLIRMRAFYYFNPGFRIYFTYNRIPVRTVQT